MKLESLDQVTAALACMRRERTLQQSLTAELNAELAKVKDRHEPEITKHAAKEKELAEQIRDWLDARRKDLLKGKTKSFTLEGHVLGYRSNGGAIEFTKKAGGAKGVLAKLKEASKKLQELFIRTKEAPDKEAMKKHWKDHEVFLVAAGVKMTTSEDFFIELDMEGSPKA
jgi:phage host-nuclease inhibitor protein Gam